MRNEKKFWIILGILMILSPLGLIIPRWFGAEGAWGEWGFDEIEKIVGFVPEGMKRLGDRWKPPLPGYALPRQSKGLVGESIGYVLSGIIGIILAAGITYLFARLARGRNNDRK